MKSKRSLSTSNRFLSLVKIGVGSISDCAIHRSSRNDQYGNFYRFVHMFVVVPIGVS